MHHKVVSGPYRTCPWHFKCLNKIGRVELDPTFATIRFWHRTTAEHVQTFCSQLSKHERHAPEKFFVACRCISIGNFQLNNGCSGFWGGFSLAQQRCSKMLWSHKRIARRDSATPITAPSTIFLDPSAAAYSWSPRCSNSDRKDRQLNPKRKAAVLIAW